MVATFKSRMQKVTDLNPIQTTNPDRSVLCAKVSLGSMPSLLVNSAE